MVLWLKGRRKKKDLHLILVLLESWRLPGRDQDRDRGRGAAGRAYDQGKLLDRPQWYRDWGWADCCHSCFTHFDQVTMSGQRRMRRPPSPTGARGSPTRTRRLMIVWWNATTWTAEGNGEWGDMFLNPALFQHYSSFRISEVWHGL